MILNPIERRYRPRQASDILERYCVYAKIYGERNTGTNFVEKLVQANFVVHCLQSNNPVHEYARILGRDLAKHERGRFRSALVDIDSERTMHSDFGWKHGAPPIEQIRSAPHAHYTLFVCIAKHPAAWLKSLVERPYNPIESVPREFGAFIRYCWPLTVRDNLPGHERIGVVDLWNAKNSAFQDLNRIAPKCIVIAYEKLLEDPVAFLEELSTHLCQKHKQFVWSLPSTKGDGLTFDDYRRKYQLGNVCATVEDDDLSFLTERVDKATMNAFGYFWPETHR